MIDSSGLYGEEVHYDMTQRIVRESDTVLPFKEILANVIAAWDLWVDYSPILTSIGSCGSCHFMPSTVSGQHVIAAIEVGYPFIFGATLHQLQDFYSHWSEGYHNPLLGHGLHSLKSKFRSDNLLSDFYEGGHYEGGKWVESPFPAHPRDMVIDHIRKRNPGIALTGLSDWNYVDLYLRLHGSPMDQPSIMQRRDYFGFEPDLYVATSVREQAMESMTRFYVSEFIRRIGEIYKAGCLNPTNIYVQPGEHPEDDVLARFFLTW